jgi:hypothetical protein
MNKQQKNLATIAIGMTSFIWLVAMALSYESQVEFALSIGLTSTIFGLQKAYAFPILTDSLIGASAVWSLLATLQGLNNIRYRAAMLFFGLVTIWFNAHSINLSQASYTTIFAISWIPAVVIISTEMLLGFFNQQVQLQREFVSKGNDNETRILVALEAIANNQNNLIQSSSNLTIAVAQDEEIAKDDEFEQINPVSPLDKAKAAKAAKYQANLAKAKALLNEGKSIEFVADDLDVTLQTARNYRTVLNGSVLHAN